MKPFVLRRLKSEVLSDLPAKSDEVAVCPMLEIQNNMYKNLISEFSEEADQNREVNGIGMMMQLRKLANHPLLIRNYYTEDKLQVSQNFDDRIEYAMIITNYIIVYYILKYYILT